MPQKSYNCNVCGSLIPREKPRIHCQICQEYNSCADCHVIESFSGLHRVSHDYEIFLDGNRVIAKDGKTVQKFAVRLEQRPTPSGPGGTKSSRPSARSSTTATDNPNGVNTAEKYWGSVVTEDKSLCPIFTRLLSAIFTHFDCTAYPLFTGRMEPSKLRAVLRAAGYCTQDVPLLTYSASSTPSASDLHELEKTLTLVYRALSVDYNMATLDPPLSPYQEPFGDGIRATYASNSMPVLTRRGFEQYLLFQIQVDPTETSLRLNHLLQSLPPLVDSETSQQFAYRHIPRSCFPPLLDPVAEELRRSIEKQRRALQLREFENAWRFPVLGDEPYNKMTPGDFMHMNGGSMWKTGRYAGGY